MKNTMREMLQDTQQERDYFQSMYADEHVGNHAVVSPTRRIGIADRFEKKDKSWFPNSKVPTDLTIQVEDITFHVHKFPLVSRSEYISRLDPQSPKPNSSYDIKLEYFPGGSDTFETIVKFCYGLDVVLTPANVAQLRCASEYLQMTEEYEDGNLISKTEAFLTFMVLSSWRDSLTVLKACESLSPWAENLQIVRRCSDSIASKVALETSTNSEDVNGEEWWLSALLILRIDHFVRIVTAIRAKGSQPETIGSFIMKYAEKWLPGMDAELEGESGFGCGESELHLSVMSGRREEGRSGQNKEQRMMIEVLVSILPPQNEAVSCKFLLRMLKMALVYSATPALVSELEKRIGMVLEDASVNDLLIPSFRNGNEGTFGRSPSEEETMHDVETVQQIVEYYLMYEQQQLLQKGGNSNVGRLLDSYLAEIAVDPNLSISKFQFLAESLPEHARSCHDGLYRAIDTYLKTHPALTEHDRRKLCKAMDCQKLSLDACMHAAQNDRLPLRTVIQVTLNREVLFSEQVKIRAAMNEKENMSSEIKAEQETIWSCNMKEIKIIKEELENVKTKMSELQHEYSELQQEFEKLKRQRGLLGWSSGWKKIRKSTVFQGKMNSVDIQDQQLGQSPTNSKNSHRRRQSIS
ncbi:hypothetical protein Sjap_022369 [Stephania japonica]|uniref:Uncharacterized protein n=1 Tax=Stephania japonica TaxID=461633 RepID=A0AAP0EU42_9MAGN